MEKWITIQVTSVAAPGLMANNAPIVAFLLQHREDDPSATRAVAAVLEDGVLYPVPGLRNQFEQGWKLEE